MAYKDKEKERLVRKAYYEKNRARKLAEMKLYRENKVRTPEEIERDNTRKREHHYANRDRNNLRRALAAITERYNVDYPTAVDLYNKSGESCWCCGEEWSSKPRPHKFHIDHDHDTGKIRGILCHPCNTALGLLEESQTRISQLSHYLEVVCGKTQGKLNGKSL